MHLLQAAPRYEAEWTETCDKYTGLRRLVNYGAPSF